MAGLFVSVRSQFMLTAPATQLPSSGLHALLGRRWLGQVSLLGEENLPLLPFSGLHVFLGRRWLRQVSLLGEENLPLLPSSGLLLIVVVSTIAGVLDV